MAPLAPNGSAAPLTNPNAPASSAEQREGKSVHGDDDDDDDDTDSQRDSSPLAIDPALDKQSESAGAVLQKEADKKLTDEESIKTAQAAIEAVLKYEEARKSRQASAAPEAQNSVADESAPAPAQAPANEKPESSSSKQDTSSSPIMADKEIEQMMTEDGEPMLNPGELHAFVILCRGTDQSVHSS